MDLQAPPSYPTLDAEPVLSPALKAALVHAYASEAYVREAKLAWLEDCDRARHALAAGAPREVPAVR